MNDEVNGFIFNSIGDLLEEPENPSLELLVATRDLLLQKESYIRASRIQHRINVIIMAN
ncbi:MULTISPECIES: hypothetical protein [Vibrio]|uniref:hypothetical protein n=1 Tax=Vibrio TaxID=662 RepID=UPI000ABD7271|nr:hypothetical protein [Vibrio parahaemolyticus]HAS6026877.1 hypothetical protein [Vibrio vulnificus]HAS6035814.1 hypothetical protein [Vibrio vulnificus]HDY7429228.1 hypothetical protein [Vibrio vulnificus]HDY7489002.1 hypothetical protein [Vibrio vulnificus]HDY7951741.1 hypothetical protein [Vibrio vulnificus]